MQNSFIQKLALGLGGLALASYFMLPKGVERRRIEPGDYIKDGMYCTVSLPTPSYNDTDFACGRILYSPVFGQWRKIYVSGKINLDRGNRYYFIRENDKILEGKMREIMAPENLSRSNGKNPWSARPPIVVR